MTKLRTTYSHSILTLILITIFALLFTSTALAENTATPEYATVEITLPEVDTDAMIAAFYGDQADELTLSTQTYTFEGISIDVTTGSLPDCESAYTYSQNNISMQRNHSISLSYRSEGEGAYLPPPSKTEGKYTQDEAIEMARNFIQSDLHIAEDTGLIVAEVRPEDASKERSRAYVISFVYAWENIPLIGTTEQVPQVMPRLTVGITDEGIVEFDGDIITVSGAKQSEGTILPSDQLTRLNPNDAMLAGATDISLCYKVGPTYEGRLAWWYSTDDTQTIPTYVDSGYDAYTGEKLS